MKEESEKIDINVNIQKAKILGSVSITSWQIDGETMKTVNGNIALILGSKSLQMVITAMKDALSLEEKLLQT